MTGREAIAILEAFQLYAKRLGIKVTLSDGIHILKEKLKYEEYRTNIKANKRQD